jgi:hypothetical protein
VKVVMDALHAWKLGVDASCRQAAAAAKNAEAAERAEAAKTAALENTVSR